MTTASVKKTLPAVLCLLCGLALCLPRAAYAQNAPLLKESSAAQAKIAACWQQTEMDRNSTSKTRQTAGANRTIECLKKEIMADSAGFSPGNKKDFADVLQKYIDKSTAVNWYVYNGHCDKDCGEDAHMQALAGTAHDLERVLINMETEMQK